MRQHISELMDGELFEDEAAVLLDKMKHNPEAHGEWLIYHLIGDTLRQPGHVHADISAVLHERLQAEPTILAPYRRGDQRARWFAVSAAASVLALAVVAWLSAQVAPEVTAPIALQTANNNVRPASLAVKGYMMAHQDYSPAANMQGPASYVRTVAEQ